MSNDLSCIHNKVLQICILSWHRSCFSILWYKSNSSHNGNETFFILNFERDLKLVVKYLLLRKFSCLRLTNMLVICSDRKDLYVSLQREPDGLPPWPLPHAISIQGCWETLAHYPQPDVFYFSITIAKWRLMSSTMGICLNLWSMKCCLLKYKYHPPAETSPPCICNSVILVH